MLYHNAPSTVHTRMADNHLWLSSCLVHPVGTFLLFHDVAFDSRLISLTLREPILASSFETFHNIADAALSNNSTFLVILDHKASLKANVRIFDIATRKEICKMMELYGGPPLYLPQLLTGSLQLLSGGLSGGLYTFKLLVAWGKPRLFDIEVKSESGTLKGEFVEDRDIIPKAVSERQSPVATISPQGSHLVFGGYDSAVFVVVSGTIKTVFTKHETEEIAWWRGKTRNAYDFWTAIKHVIDKEGQCHPSLPENPPQVPSVMFRPDVDSRPSTSQ